MPRRAKTQSFYSHGEESIQVKFHTVEVHPGKLEGYLQVLTPGGDFNFILDSIEDEKLELLSKSLERALIKVSNLLFFRGGKSDES